MPPFVPTPDPNSYHSVVSPWKGDAPYLPRGSMCRELMPPDNNQGCNCEPKRCQRLISALPGNRPLVSGYATYRDLAELPIGSLTLTLYGKLDSVA